MNAIELIRAIKTEQEAEAAAKVIESQTNEARCVAHFFPVLDFFKQIEHLDARAYWHHDYNRIPLRYHVRTRSGSHIMFCSGSGHDGHTLSCLLDARGQPQIQKYESGDIAGGYISPDRAIKFLCEYAIAQDVKLP